MKKFNFVKNFTYLYLFLFIFLLCYSLFRAEFVHDGNQFNYYYKYYLIFSFGIFFWILVLFLDDNKKKQAIVFVSSLIFILYFYEIVRYYSLSILETSFVKSLQNVSSPKIKSNAKTKYDRIQELKILHNVDVVPSIFPKALIKHSLINEKIDIFPLGGISDSITVFCKEGERYSIYKSDRYGFNNPDESWDGENLKWFLVGDSFTQGSCVQQNENFSSQLALFSGKKAISVGMAGNGPLIELASLKEYGHQKKPDIVLWFYFERNDLLDLENEKNSLILMKYLDKNFNQNLHTKQIEINKNLKRYIDFSENKLNKKFLSEEKNQDMFLSFKKIIRLQIIRDKMALDRGMNLSIDPLFNKIMIRAKKLVNEWNGQLYFVYLPDKERYSSNTFKDEQYLRKSQVIRLINSLKIPVIDIDKEFFAKQADPLSFYAHRIYGHYSPDGYKRISKFIVKKLQSLN